MVRKRVNQNPLIPIEPVLDEYDVRYNSDRRHWQSVRCPFHEDRQASGSVNLDEAVFVCHGCGCSGSAITVLMKHEGLDYDSARSRYETLSGGKLPDIRRGSRRKPSERLPLEERDYEADSSLFSDRLCRESSTRSRMVPRESLSSVSDKSRSDDTPF